MERKFVQARGNLYYKCVIYNMCIIQRDGIKNGRERRRKNPYILDFVFEGLQRALRQALPVQHKNIYMYVQLQTHGNTGNNCLVDKHSLSTGCLQRSAYACLLAYVMLYAMLTVGHIDTYI